MPEAKNKINLTDLHIRNKCIPAPDGRRATYTDAAQPGLVLLVTPAGRKTFYVVRRPAGSDKPHWHKLGAYPGTSLAEARRAAPAILRTLADGKTPKEVKDDERRAEAALRRSEADRERNTFGAVAEDFIKEHLPRRRSAKPAEALIRKKLIPAWRDRPMNKIGRGDVITLVKEVAHNDGRYAAHHAFAQVSKMIAWALNNNRGDGSEISTSTRVVASGSPT